MDSRHTLGNNLLKIKFKRLHTIQVSIKFAEGLQRRMMNKISEKWTFAYYNLDRPVMYW